MADWSAVRREFPSLEKWTYLNTATYGQLPRCAVAAVEGHFSRRDAFASADFLEWFDDLDGIRASLARLIHCEAGDIGFFMNAGAALSMVARAVLTPGSAALTLDGEFPNHLYAVQWLDQVESRIVPWSGFYDALDARVKLVTISTANYSTGFMPPLDGLAEACRKVGAVLVIDGTQSLGAMRFDVRQLQPDLFVVDGYKWLLSPNGATFAYVSPELRRRVPPDAVGWRSDRRWREVASLHHGAPEFPSDAERYEAGMVAFPSLYGMGASVNLMLELGPQAIEERVLGLAAYTRDVLRGTGAILRSDSEPHHDGPIVAARWPGADAVTLYKQLRERRILASARHGNLRLSAHFYNNEDDIDILGKAIRDLLP
jgi:cysteine desulfurase / selenocysteine lyase